MANWSRRTFLKAGGALGATPIGLTTTTGLAQAASSEELWSFKTGNWVWSSPTVVDGTVYVGSGDGYLYVVDAETGEQRWRFKTGDWVRSSPTVVEGTVYFGGWDGNLYAVDAESGEERWRLDMGHRIQSSPIVVDETVYIGSAGLYAVDAETGEQRWRFVMRNATSASPTVVDGTVYIGSADRHLYAVDSETGEERWHFETSGNLESSPTVVDETVFVGSEDGYLYAVDSETGEQRWHFETGKWVNSSPTVANGTVYIGSGDSFLYAVEANSGKQRWRFQTGGPVQSSPTVVDGTVCIGSGDNFLYAVDAKSGEQRWRFQTDDWIYSSPTVVGGTVYVGSSDNYLYAIDAGVEGSSEGSRVFLGTLGHHGTRDFTIEELSQTTSPTPSASTDGKTASPTPVLTETQTAPQVSERPLRFLASELGIGAQMGEELGTGLVGVLTASVVAKKSIGYLHDRDQSEGGPETNPIDERLQDARDSVDDAESHEEDGYGQTAIETFESAVTQYESILESLPTTDDRYEDIAAELETAEEKLAQVQTRYAKQSEFIEEVRTAETQFQTAIAAPTSDRVILPRERYRQARDGYDRALELHDELDHPSETVTISPDVDIEPPPESLSQFPGLTPAATEYLEEHDVDTLSTLRDADEETIDNLRSADAIHEKLAIRLIGLHYWIGDDSLTLAGREELEGRKKLAADGYRAHQ